MKKLVTVLMFLILGFYLNLAPAAADPLGIEIPVVVTSEDIQLWANDACPDAKYDTCKDEVANCVAELQKDLINKTSGWCFKKNSDTWACKDDSYSSLEGYVAWVKTHPKDNPATNAVEECNEIIITGIYLKPNYEIYLNLIKLTCGNGQFDTGEECEDGNLVDGDGCSASCKLEKNGGGDSNIAITPKVIDERANLACTVLLDGPESLKKTECNEAYQACMQEARHVWYQGLKEKCGNKILTGAYGPDYLYYCNSTQHNAVDEQSHTVVPTFEGFFEKNCNTKLIPPGDDNDGNEGGKNNGGNNGVSGGDNSANPSKPGVGPGVNLAGGACSLMPASSNSGAALSLALAALFSLPLFRSKRDKKK